MPDPVPATSSRNPLAMFAPQPQGVTFENQEENEQIVLLLRAHLVTLVPALLLIVFLLFVPAIVSGILSFLSISISLAPNQTLLILLFWYLLVFGYAFYRFVFWFFNVYLVTNERIVDFDFKGILNKEFSYTTLIHIEDVEPKTVGFFGTFFNYGNVYIQTAAERPEFEFEKVPRPDDVAEKILVQVRLEEQESPGEVL